MRFTICLLVMLVCGASGLVAANEPSSEQAKVWKLLVQRQYADLESKASQLQAAYEQDNVKEEAVELFVHAFRTSNYAIEPHIQEWIQRYPRSYLARVAAGEYYIKRAWLARSDNYYNELMPEQIAGFERFSQRARSELEVSLKLTSKPTHAYAALLSAVTGAGRSSERSDLLQRSFKVHPTNFRAREAYLHFLQPQWGGSFEAMDQFVDSARQAGVSEEKVRCLAADVLIFRNRNRQATDAYVKTMTDILDLCPRITAYHNRAWANWRLKRIDETIADYERTLARDMHDGLAMSSLGLLFFGKTGRDQDAVSWCVKGGEENHAQAYHCLAYAFMVGRGVGHDTSEAMWWLHKAAEAGWWSSQYDLAMKYLNGQYVPRDREKAVMWLRHAAAQGHDGAKAQLKQLDAEKQDTGLMGQIGAMLSRLVRW